MVKNIEKITKSTEEVVIIKEDKYQKIKTKMNKKDDNFDMKELIEFTKNYINFDVILT